MRLTRTEPARMFYVPFYQRHAEGEYVFAVRTTGDPDSLARQIPAEVNAVTTGMPVLGITTLPRQIDARIANERLLATMSGWFGGLALLLAGVGIYGIVAYTMSRRLPEFGVRLALGAARGHVIWQVVRDGIVVVGAGVAIGLAVTLLASDRLASLVFGIEPTEPLVYTIAAVALIVVGVLSTVPVVPRTLQIEPIAVLRSE